MKTKVFLALGLIAATVWLSNCQQQPETEKKPDTQSAATEAERVKRGEYLVGMIGCDDCHTPKKFTPQGAEPDLSRRFMGHPAEEPFSSDDKKKQLIAEQQVAIFNPGLTAFAGLWGVSYAANLTPDDTGIGTWTEAQFFKAIREGKSKGLDGTRPLLPPMPWPIYRNMTDEDLRSVFAYLKTVKPIQNVVPKPVGP